MADITFNACEHLAFGDNYDATKELVSTQEGDKVLWHRNSVDYPLVQFCKKQGRLNDPVACLCENSKRCNDFKDFKHSVSNVLL